MTRPSLFRMMRRAVIRRCPWCGGRGAFFTGWFAKAPQCQSCGLRWRRGDVGFELGAAAVAAMITLGPLVGALGIVMAVTWPDIAVGALLAAFGPAAVALPVVAYPLSYTIWQALDLAVRPVRPEDFDAAVIVADAFDGASPPGSG